MLQIIMSLLPVVREMIPFGREELTSQVPKECFLSNHQQSSYSPLGLKEIEFSLDLILGTWRHGKY